MSPLNTGLALGLSSTHQWWVVSTDVDAQSGGNLVKLWDGGGTDASNWKSTKPPRTGFAVGPR